MGQRNKQDKQDQKYFDQNSLEKYQKNLVG